MAGILLTRLKPRLARSCLTMSMNGPRLRTTWPFLTLTELRLAGERLHQLLVHEGVGLDPGPGEPRARHDLVDLAVNGSGDPAGDRRGHRFEQRTEFGQSAGRQRGLGLTGISVYVEPGGDLGRDLVGQGILDRRIMDQRLHRGHVAAGVADLVGRPHGQHRCRRQHAAEHDEDRSHPGSPAEAPTPGRARWLLEQVASFILRAGRRRCCRRPSLGAVIRQDYLPPAARGKPARVASQRWPTLYLTLHGPARGRLTLRG